MLRELLPGRRVLAGMVPFNVIRREQGAYHRGSAGVVMIERAPAAQPFVQAARRANLPLALRDDMAAVQWAKLVLNLNNAINALSGQPLAAELAQRDFRRCLAAAQREAFARAGRREDAGSEAHVDPAAVDAGAARPARCVVPPACPSSRRDRSACAIVDVG